MMIHHQDEREMTLIFLDSVVIVLICIWLEITLIIYHEDKENWHKNFTVMKHEHSLSSHKKWLYEEGKYFTDFFWGWLKDLSAHCYVCHNSSFSMYMHFSTAIPRSRPLCCTEILINWESSHFVRIHIYLWFESRCY